MIDEIVGRRNARNGKRLDLASSPAIVRYFTVDLLSADAASPKAPSVRGGRS
jgi:hypothetical protein